jgi:hypothetical protein
MQKPNAYNETKENGSYTPIELGGHLLVIKQVRETQSKAGKPMIVVCYDTAKNDKQPEYMSEEFKNDVRPEKKWPRVGTEYIVTEDKDGNCSRKFKSFISCFERSNGCEAVWGEKFEAQFKNKKIGGVFGEVENEYNGNVTMRHELRYFCDYDKAADANIPAPQYLKTTTPPPTTPPSGANDGFMNIPDDADDEIPF